MSHPQDNILTVLTLALLICLSAFTVDITLSVLPDIAKSFNVDSRLGSMTVSMYMLGYALGQIPYGLCADRFGRLPVVYVGLVLFILIGLLNAYARSIDELLVLRFLHGLAGAVAAVLSRSIVRDISTGSRTVELMSIMTIALGVSTLTAPVVGSYMADAFGWRSTLIATALISIILIFMFMCCVKETKPEQDAGYTLWQQLVISFTAFKSQHQSIWAMSMLALGFGGYASILVSTAPILQEIYGMSTSATGIILGISLSPYFLGAIYSHRYSSRIGAIKTLGFGIKLFAITGILLVPIIISGEAELIFFWPILLFYIFGIGVIFPCVTAIILHPLPKSAGFASSIAGTVQLGTGAAISTLAAMLYSGSIRDLAVILFIASFLITSIFLMKGYLGIEVED